MRAAAGAIASGVVVAAAVFWPGTVLADESKYSVLMIGNSHSTRANLPDVLEKLLKAGDGDAESTVKAAGGQAFLADRLDDKRTQKKLESRPWTHVILQAQKYSTSGKYDYGTEAAEEWIRRARNAGAQPILFPEWARRDHKEEGARVHRLHVGIAAREAACVAPIGLAWEILMDNHPDIRLHDADGNHANRNGALLTAYVLYAAITGRSIMDLPDTRVRGVTEDDQDLLQIAAEKAVSLFPPCESQQERPERPPDAKL